MKDTLVLDVETKKSFEEVGGKQNLRSLGVAVVGVYSYAKDAFFAFEEKEADKFENILLDSERLVGFNIKGFDLPVLEPYLQNVSWGRFSVVDIFEDVVSFLGHRLGLGVLAKATLGRSKSGNGLEALQWFKEGRVEDVKKYCLDDVRLTRDLYEYGKKNGCVLFESLAGGKINSVPVSWGKNAEKPLLALLEEAFAGRKRLKIDYVSAEAGDSGFRKSRLVDVYHLKNSEFKGFCHLRGNVRNFRINRVLSAEITGDSYVIPADFQQSLF